MMLPALRRACTASRLRIASRYASDFGRRNGGAIANKASILSDVDDALTGGRPPDLEVLLADHLTAVDSPAAEWAHTLFLRYGHVSVRYTTSDGRQRVMNILGGVEGADMVNMVEPSDYLYGTHGCALCGNLIWTFVSLYAIKPTRPRGQRRVDGVGRPKFDSTQAGTRTRSRAAPTTATS